MGDAERRARGRRKKKNNTYLIGCLGERFSKKIPDLLPLPGIEEKEGGEEKGGHVLCSGEEKRGMRLQEKSRSSRPISLTPGEGGPKIFSFILIFLEEREKEAGLKKEKKRRMEKKNISW